jgi:uncharacterized membrane protein
MIRWKENHDILIISLSSIILILVIGLIPSGTVLRVIIGLPFLLFFPGYSILLIGFPKRQDLGGLARLVFSFGISIAIVPLIGLLLNYSSFGIRLEPILLGVAALNILASSLGYYRRINENDPYLPSGISTLEAIGTKYLRTDTKYSKALIAVLAVSIVLPFILLAIFAAFPPPGATYTEFEIVGPDGKATGYPSNLTVNETSIIDLKIINHEETNMNYTIQIFLVNITADQDTVRVNHMYYLDTVSIVSVKGNDSSDGQSGSQSLIPYNLTIEKPGQFKLWLILFKNVVPPLPSAPNRYDDFANTSAVQLINDSIDNKYQSLNLNLNITP